MTALFSLALSRLWSVLAVGITVPLWLLVAAGIWLHVDKSSAVRAALAEAVAGAELAAARAEADAAKAIAAELQGRATALATANARFADSLQQAQYDLENANDQIADMAAAPVDPDCRVNDDLLGRLRSR